MNYFPFLDPTSREALSALSYLHGCSLAVPTMNTIGEYVGDEYIRPHWAVSFRQHPHPTHAAVIRGEVPDSHAIAACPDECVLILTGHQYSWTLAHTAAVCGNVGALKAMGHEESIGDKISLGNADNMHFLVIFTALLGGDVAAIQHVMRHTKIVGKYPYGVLFMNAVLSGAPNSLPTCQALLPEGCRKELTHADKVLEACMLGDVVTVQRMVTDASSQSGKPIRVSRTLNLYIEIRLDPFFEDVEPLHTASLCGSRAVVAMPALDPNAVDRYGRTPMHYAALGGQTDVLRMLRARGSDVGALDNMKMAPCHYAAVSGQLAALHYLCLHGADLTALDIHGRGVVHFAAYAGRLEGVRYALAHAGCTSQLQALSLKEGFAPFHYAVACGHVEAAKMLIAAGADPMQKTVGGMTARRCVEDWTLRGKPMQWYLTTQLKMDA